MLNLLGGPTLKAIFLIALQLGVILGPTYPRTTPTLHGVNLSWTASVTPGVTYNVYRSTVSGGPYTRIVTGLGGTSYSDSGLPSSTTYYYVTTSVDSVGESGYSGEASATTL